MQNQKQNSNKKKKHQLFQKKVNHIASKIGIIDTHILFDQHIKNNLKRIHHAGQSFSHSDYDKQLMLLISTVKSAMVNEEAQVFHFHFIDAEVLDFKKMVLRLDSTKGYCHVSRQILH